MSRDIRKLHMLCIDDFAIKIKTLKIYTICIFKNLALFRTLCTHLILVHQIRPNISSAVEDI